MPKQKKKKKKGQSKKKKNPAHVGRTLSVILFRVIRERAKKWQALQIERKTKIQLVSEKTKLTKKQLDFYKREEVKAAEFKEQTQKSLDDEENSLMTTMSYFLRRYDQMAKSAQRLQNTMSEKMSQEKAASENLTKMHRIYMKNMKRKSLKLSCKIHASRTEKTNVEEYLNECYEINDVKFCNLLQYFENLKALQEKEMDEVQEILARNIRKNQQIFEKEVEECAAPCRPEVVNKLSSKSRTMALESAFCQREISKLRCCETFNKLYNAFMQRDIGQLQSGPTDPLLAKEIIAPGLFQKRIKCQPEDDVQLDIPVKIYVPF